MQHATLIVVKYTDPYSYIMYCMLQLLIIHQ